MLTVSNLTSSSDQMATKRVGKNWRSLPDEEQVRLQTTRCALLAKFNKMRRINRHYTQACMYKQLGFDFDERGSKFLNLNRRPQPKMIRIYTRHKEQIEMFLADDRVQPIVYAHGQFGFSQKDRKARKQKQDANQLVASIVLCSLFQTNS